jgi:hypothetical protein
MNLLRCATVLITLSGVTTAAAQSGGLFNSAAGREAATKPLPPAPHLAQPVRPAAGGNTAETTYYQGGKGATTSVVVTKAKPPRVDLVISEVQWLPPQPLHDESGFLKTMKGLGSAAGRGATLVPRLFVGAMTSTEGPKQRSTTDQALILSPVIRVKVRNNGTERWAAKGLVDVQISPGRPEDVTFEDSRRNLDEAKQLLPLGRGTWVNSGTLLSGIGAIPGSIGPGGDETEVQVAFLHGLAHPKDHMARYRFRMLVDKYYTAKINLQTKGDSTAGNNLAEYVFRLDAHGAVAEGKLFQRSSISNIRVESSDDASVKKK